MNRRRFLSVLAAGVAGLAIDPQTVIDPERAAWRKGATKIFIFGRDRVEQWKTAAGGPLQLRPGFIFSEHDLISAEILPIDRAERSYRPHQYADDLMSELPPPPELANLGRASSLGTQPPHPEPSTCPRCGNAAAEMLWRPYCAECLFWLFDGQVDRSAEEQAELEKRYPPPTEIFHA